MYPGMGFYFDPTMILIIIGAVISMIASARVKSTYQKYSKVRSMSGLTGAQAAEKIIRAEGLQGVTVRKTSGHLSDHYDPRSKTVNLSESVYGSTSVAAIGIAAHECGHAVQHHKKYAALSLRAAILPVANLGSQLSWPLVFFGIIIGQTSLINLGIILFTAVIVFQLVTLPVEFNASSRALQLVENIGILGSNEVKTTKKVLDAAALTYVAAVAASLLQLLRLLLIARGRDND